MLMTISAAIWRHGYRPISAAGPGRGRPVIVVEERTEMCGVATKLVSVRLSLQLGEDQNGEGQIVDFHCSSSGANCDHKCTYRLLMMDF